MKDGTDELSSSGNAGAEKRLVDTAGKGKNGTYVESGTERYTWPYITAGGNSLYDAGSSHRCSVTTWVGVWWDGAGCGREAQERGDMCTPVADSC